MLEDLTQAIKNIGQGAVNFARDTFVPSELQDIFGGESDQGGGGFNFGSPDASGGQADQSFSFGDTGFATQDLSTKMGRPQATQPTVQMGMQPQTIQPSVQRDRPPAQMDQPPAQMDQLTDQMDMKQESIANPMKGGLPFFSDMGSGGLGLGGKGIGGEGIGAERDQPPISQQQSEPSLRPSMPQQSQRPLGERVMQPENTMLRNLNRPESGATRVLPGERAMQIGNRRFRFDEPLPEFRLDLPENR